MAWSEAMPARRPWRSCFLEALLTIWLATTLFSVRADEPGFTSAATDYSLRVLLPDINRGLKVQSDLRIAIFEALRKADVQPAPAQAAVPEPAPA